MGWPLEEAWERYHLLSGRSAEDEERNYIDPDDMWCRATCYIDALERELQDREQWNRTSINLARSATKYFEKEYEHWKAKCKRALDLLGTDGYDL